MRISVVALVLLGACGDDSAVEDLSSAAHDLSADQAVPACTRASDLFSQNCPAGQKCITNGNNPAMFSCVPVQGSGMYGDTCGLNDAGSSVADDCAVGLICWSEPAGKHCEKFCVKDADCTQPLQYCRAGGFCGPSCTFGGTDCPSGYSCAGTKIDYDGGPRLFCTFYGTTALGSACTASSDCVANAVCAGSPGTCRPVCDGTHACAAGTCTPLPPAITVGVLGACI